MNSSGYKQVRFNGVMIPTLTFGGKLGVGTWMDKKDMVGIIINELDKNKCVGDFLPSYYDINDVPNIKCYLRFDNTKSVDVVINSLKIVKKKLKKLKKMKKMNTLN